ncbi:MAG: MBL fold metallo-hydrolase [Candidatus Hinthialibacter antarcticus]|nr:MBL fold metallo-hydrolase [Candidatus Hinthialibacter antarcticus]
MTEWRVYGCGSASSSQFMQSSYEFTSGDTRLHVDFGNGALYQRCRLEGDIFKALDSIEHLFITHSHADHIVDLTRHVVAWKYTPNYSPGKPVHLYATKHTLERVEHLLEYATFPGLFDEVFVSHPVEENRPMQIGPLTVRPFLVKHMPGAVGLHVESPDGASAAFTADTAPFNELHAEIQDASLLISEASFCEKDHPMHLTVSQAAELAEKVNAKTLLMVHAYPEVEELEQTQLQDRVGKYFSGEYFAAHDGMSLVWDPNSQSWNQSKMF